MKKNWNMYMFTGDMYDLSLWMHSCIISVWVMASFWEVLSFEFWLSACCLSHPRRTTVSSRSQHSGAQRERFGLEVVWKLSVYFQVARGAVMWYHQEQEDTPRNKEKPWESVCKEKLLESLRWGKKKHLQSSLLGARAGQRVQGKEL